MDKETKQESSIPVQSRVSIVTLALLTKYWKGEDRDIKTVSQLVSWSLYLLTEILSSNGLIEQEPSVEEARIYMMENKLFQRGMAGRGSVKLDYAIKFQGIRERGGSPQQSMSSVDRTAYNTMHRKPNRFNGKPSSVEPFTGKVYNEQVKKAVEIMNNLPEELDNSVLDELTGAEFNKKVNAEGLYEQSVSVKEQPAKECEQSVKKEASDCSKVSCSEPMSIEERIRVNEEEANRQLDELNKFDPRTLMGKAIKEEKDC